MFSVHTQRVRKDSAWLAQELVGDGGHLVHFVLHDSLALWQHGFGILQFRDTRSGGFGCRRRLFLLPPEEMHPGQAPPFLLAVCALARTPRLNKRKMHSPPCPARHPGTSLDTITQNKDASASHSCLLRLSPSSQLDDRRSSYWNVFIILLLIRACDIKFGTVYV
jgi:hypothetical protein